MKFKYHILTGALVSYLLTLIFDLNPLIGIIIFSASVLIDGDHYLWYAYGTKDLNPFNAIRWYIKFGSRWGEIPPKKLREYGAGVFIFHNWICWAILLVLGFTLHPFFYWVLIGFAIHIIPDLIVLFMKGKSILEKISLGHVLKKNKGKKGIKEYNKYFEVKSK